MLGCTGAELLSFDGKTLRRSPLAARKFMPTAGGEAWRSLPILDESVDTVFYPHSNSTYLLSTSRRGFLQAIPISEPIGRGALDKSSQPGSVLTPVAVTSANLKNETPGTVVGGLEGESPIISVHKSDVYVMTTFQRLWRYDAMQVIPCGNIMKYFKSVFAEWSVPAGAAEKQEGIVHLRAFSADPTSSRIAWKCELSKKAIHIAAVNATLAKHIACCNPALASQKSKSKMACCVKKEANARENATSQENRIVQEALLNL